MAAALHALTPVLAVQDPRGLAVRKVDYCRVVANEAAERRVHGTRHDVLGHPLESRDPRLWALHEQDGTTPANLRQVHSLSGRELSRDSVDAGFACTLFGEAGQAAWFEDGKGIRRELQYDALLRPLALHEQGLCSERYLYAEGTAEHGLINACGRLLRHDDSAGSLTYQGYALGGGLSREARRFCRATDWPDWPVPVEERDALLEPEVARSSWRHGPLGDVLAQSDAAGNRQYFGLTVAGQLRDVRVQLEAGAEPIVLSEARYNAFGLMEEERLGNGVTLQRLYREDDGRLLRLDSWRNTGERLQALEYTYDPAGNVVAIEDLAQPLRHFANQRIQPRCEYFHDSLYQLREATGWEAGTVSRGPGVLLDSGAVSNYRQTYRYDAGGNLLELTHTGAQAHGRTLVAGRHSNRCLPEDEDFAGRFDANGNLLRLQPGQGLLWNPRNELREVRPVVREGGIDDWECYLYDGAGQRVRKLASKQAANRTHHRETRYLPGLERHNDSATGERYEVIVLQAGTCGVRILHWLEGRPDEVPQDQVRYALGDHLGSSSLELDGEAALISHEVFHPFGSTAWWAARSEIEAGYKRIRYSGKERDATGLYYYGARYYRTDWQRWLNPDRAGEVDGLNLYCMVGNAPVNRQDRDGRQGFDVMDAAEMDLVNQGDQIVANGFDHFPPDLQRKFGKAIRLGRELAREVRLGIKGKRNEQVLRRTLRSAFGADGTRRSTANKHAVARLALIMKSVGAYLRDLKEDPSRLLLVDFRSPQEHGSTLSTGVEGRSARIAISTRRAAGNVADLAATLFHESLHALDRDHRRRVKPGHIFDFWYLMPSLSYAGSLARQETMLHARLASSALDGPDEGEMTPFAQRWYEDIVNECSEALGLKRARSVERRREYFQRHLVIRQRVMLQNADTLTAFAMTFHNHRRSK